MAALPLVLRAMAPMPLSMLALVTLLVLHESVAVSPDSSEVAEAVRVQVGASCGGGIEVTVTVVSHVAVPPSPVAVPV